MPSLPYLIQGTVKDSRNKILIGIEVLVKNTTKNSNPLVIITDSNGKYIADAANFNTDYSSGDSVSVEAFNSFKDEYKSESFVITGTGKTQNLTLEVISSLQKGTVGYSNPVILVNANNKPFSKENPLYVETLTDIRKTTRTTYTASGFEEYHAEAVAGALDSEGKWRISKRTYNASDQEISLKWASGNANYDKVFDNRTSYDYL